MKSVDVMSKPTLLLSASPPSGILKSEFSKFKQYPVGEDVLSQIAKKALLTTEDAKIWMDHLHSIVLNRKRGAQKAAATRRAKKAQNSSSTTTAQRSTTYCGGCWKEYEDETVEVELWICCDLCNQWMCGTCECLSLPPTTNTYLCKKCQSK